MSIGQFCAEYELDIGIEKKLDDNQCTCAQMLCYITAQELKEMDFYHGEIAGLRIAIEKWSVPNK